MQWRRVALINFHKVNCRKPAAQPVIMVWAIGLARITCIACIVSPVDYSRPDAWPYGRTDVSSTMDLGVADTAQVAARRDALDTQPTRARLRQSYLQFRAMVSAVPCARGHVRLVLREWGLEDLADAVEQVVSELVTNAIKASSELAGSRFGGHWSPDAPPVRLWLLSDSRTLLVEVWDGSDQMPRLKDLDPEGEHGRGLWLVEALSEDWGVFRPAHASGKVTWAAIAKP